MKSQLYQMIRGPIECSEKMLELLNNFSKAYPIITNALMPGDNYLTILSHLHRHLKPESYVEIGVASGRTLALACDCTKTIGIDPQPLIRTKIEPGKKIYPITSDEFFSYYDLYEELGTKNVSLVFLDGLHQFEQTLKDFINIERYANKKTVVLVHDCVPINPKVASRDKCNCFWTGDVWKIVPCLIQNRPDLKLDIIPTRPAGLCMISNLNSESILLKQRFEHITTRYKTKELPYKLLNLKKFDLDGIFPNVLPNDWPAIIGRLSTTPSA